MAKIKITRIRDPEKELRKLKRAFLKEYKKLRPYDTERGILLYLKQK